MTVTLEPVPSYTTKLPVPSCEPLPKAAFIRIFKALADPNRLKIVGLLAQQPYSVEQLAALLGVGESTVSHHLARLAEVELVAALHKGGRNIPIASALDHVMAYAIGLDMTRRDLQRGMGDEKKPWEIGRASCRERV